MINKRIKFQTEAISIYVLPTQHTNEQLHQKCTMCCFLFTYS